MNFITAVHALVDAAACAVAGFNADGRLDIGCIDSTRLK
jgi:hypothetical protein